MTRNDHLIPWLPVPVRNYARAQVKRAFNIDLGKMLQPKQSDPNDREVPYLRSANVHWGRLRIDDISRMWASEREIQSLDLQQGDLLVCEGGEVGRAARVDVTLPEDCIIQNALHRVRGNERGNVGFLQYLLHSAADQGWFDVLCNKATIAHFTGEKFREMWIFLPTAVEQEQIASYLDRETARIDTLVREKERMLVLLEQKRSALISRAVTRGLNPKAPIKPSHLDWLPEIPEHWSPVKISRLFSQVKRLGFPDEEVLSVYREFGVVIRRDRNDNANRVPDDLSKYQLVKKGDLVINKMKAWQGSLGISDYDGITSPDYVVFSPLHRENPLFLHLLFRIDRMKAVYHSMSNGIRTNQWRIEPDRFLSFKLYLPPLQEQQKIVTYVKAQADESKKLESALRDSIALLQERRTALIVAAVTGRISLEEMTA